jgi:hypothetical protein
VTADWRAPGPDRPTDPRDDLVQALLGLRWALPRTDADARVALDQLSAVTARISQLAGEQPGDETPWDGRVQALLAQAGFALDWWRPVLDDVDLDWTLNHQAHLSADLARIASAGARILDQFAPAVPNPIAAPASAVTEGPPQPHHPPRVAAAFGSVPAAAIIDPLANSGRHRRPAYEFDSFDAMDAPGAGPQVPQDLEPPQPQQPYLPSAPFTSPVQFASPYPQTHSPQPQAPPEQFRPLEPLDPELEALFRPEPAQAPADAPPAPASVRLPAPAPSPSPSPIFGPPALFAPNGPGVPPAMAPPRGRSVQGPPPAPSAFSRPVVWSSGGSGGFDDGDDDPIVRPGRRGPHAGMVLQAVGILGAVAALCWWAASSLHLGSAPTGHPVAASSSAHPVTSTAAATMHSPAPATSAKGVPSPVTSVTTPPGGQPAPNAANVTALQVQLLGGSATQHQVGLFMAVNTSGTGKVTVTVDYYGMKNGAKTGERTASWTLSGKTAYQVAAGIPSGAYCGETFTLKAASGDATATQTTNPGC